MDNDYVLNVDGELYHWGIKGMRWGQRRYQNRDGSLTPAGKKRYAEEVEATKAREASIKKREREAKQREKLDAKKAELDAREKALQKGKVDPSADAKKTKKAAKESEKPKSLKDMSDAEIKAAIARKQLEDQYRQNFPEQIPKGRQIVDKFLNEAIIPAAIKGGKDLLEKSIEKIAKKALADKIDPNSIEGLTKIKEKLALQKSIKELREGTVDERTKEYALGRKKLEDDREDAAYDAGAENRKLKRDKERLTTEDQINKILADRKAEADAKAKAKAEADAKARRENEARSREEYENGGGPYRKTNGEKTQIDTNPKPIPNNLAMSVYKSNSPVVSAGKSRVRDDSETGKVGMDLISKISAMTKRGNKSYADIASQLGISTSTVQKYSKGKSAVEKMMTYDENGNFVGYWSAIKDDGHAI